MTQQTCHKCRTAHPDVGAHLTGQEAAAATGLTYRIVDYVTRAGKVEPAVPADGSGTRRGFTAGNLAALFAYADMRALAGNPTRGISFAEELVDDLLAQVAAGTDPATATHRSVSVEVDTEECRRRAKLAVDKFGVACNRTTRV